MNKHSIAVFGEALVDDFLSEQVVGGAPFNVARHLAAFGLAPLTITRIGTDAIGAQIRAEFERFGMLQAGLQIDPQAPSGRVVVERISGQHRFEILPEQAYDHIDATEALDAIARHAPAIVYFGTLAQRDTTSRGALHNILRASHAQRYLDLNIRVGQVTERCVYESLGEADTVKVNEEELADLLGWYTPARHSTADMRDPALQGACKALMRSFRLQELIVTLGERGAVYFKVDGGVDGAVEHSPGAAAPAPLVDKLVDTVGAGDAFSAIYLLGRVCGWPVATTLARANEFAAAICGIAGAVPDDTGFYDTYRARWLAD